MTTLLAGQVRIFNAGNSCYIDSVLFAMFAVPSPGFDHLLMKRLQSSDHHSAEHRIALQGYIHKQFAGRILRCENVTADVITSIRRMCRRVGWEYPGAEDQQQDAAEFYSFLHGILGGQLIRTTRKTFTGALPDNSDRVMNFVDSCAFSLKKRFRFLIPILVFYEASIFFIFSFNFYSS